MFNRKSKNTQKTSMQTRDSVSVKNIFDGRILVTVGIITAALTGLVTRYGYLQIYHHQEYRSKADSNRIRLQPLSPPRGYIFDRNGHILADLKPVFTVMIDPREVTNIDNLLLRLQPLFDLSFDDIARITKQFKYRKDSTKLITVKVEITQEQFAEFNARKPFFNGVFISNKMTRNYPHKELFAHVLGYVGRINDRDQKRINKAGKKQLYASTDVIGKLGIEKQYEDILLGKPGYQSIEANAYGKTIHNLNRVEPVPGNDLMLSLDYGLQLVANRALDGRRGAIVAIDPNNGEVLAFVSNPSYDPNPFVRGISHKAYNKLRNDRDQPLYNRALQGLYPPASTIKPIAGLAGIHYGLTSWDYKIRDKGYFSLPDNNHRFRDWRKFGHGLVDLDKSVWISCDTYYYQLAYKMGIDRYHKWMSDFGFGKKTGIDLPYEKRGVMPSREWKLKTQGRKWSPGDTISASIGQGYFLATPLQIASATATMANKGNHITPHFLKRTTGAAPLEKNIQSNDYTVEFNGTQRDWNKMHKAMKNVVSVGTAKLLKESLYGYQIAGKTGTAQVKSIAQGKRYEEDKLDDRHLDHALFMGFAPANNPRVAVGVIIENGKHGSSTAGPVAKQVFDYVVHRMDKAPITPQMYKRKGNSVFYIYDQQTINDTL